MRHSAGIVLYRHTPAGGVELLLAHMGGPFWAGKDAGAWTIPKGEIEDGETPLAVARREFEEELGLPPPAGEPIDLGEISQRGGKRVAAFACEGDLDPAAVQSNTFTIEWPRGSGRQRAFPEIDRAAWYGPDEARAKLVSGQAELVDRLLLHLAAAGEPQTRPA